MKIVLEGGPKDGVETYIPEDRTNIRIPTRNGVRSYTALRYVRRKYMPEWAGFCAMPIHRWMYDE